MESPARRRLARRLRILLWRSRRFALAALIAIGALAAINAIRPPQPALATIVVAAHQLSTGTTLTSADMAFATVEAPAPPWSLPAAEMEAVIGRSVMAPLAGGAPIQPSQLLGPSIVEDYPSGTVLVPVHFDSAAVTAIVEPGRTIDVYAATPGSSTGEADRVARHATVVLVTATGDGDGLFASGGTASATVVLAVDESEAGGLLGTGNSDFATLYPVLLR